MKNDEIKREVLGIFTDNVYETLKEAASNG